ncbi:DUF4158 domain-containing protein [Nonomuraea sp. NPDC049709]|uniref:DUF4158 domain-containing protein n=1 Tax=Nonomuraea sp. NPDC049709 TaxID=3154736 RepID=UPI00343469E2
MRGEGALARLEAPIPASFLSAEQRSRYGVFNAVPDIAQLGAFFHLNGDDRRRAMAANGTRTQLGWSVQLGTARFLNCFLDDPEDVPTAVVDYVAEQLGLQAADATPSESAIGQDWPGQTRSGNRCDTNPGSPFHSYGQAKPSTPCPEPKPRPSGSREPRGC